MGLDTSHGCWNGAYSSFADFRDAIAFAAGLPFLADGNYLLPDAYRNESYLYGYNGRETDPMPDDVIWVLLAHSDCEGRIPARFCVALAARIENLAVPEAHKERLNDFVTGLRDAADCLEDVMFW